MKINNCLLAGIIGIVITLAAFGMLYSGQASYTASKGVVLLDFAYQNRTGNTNWITNSTGASLWYWDTDKNLGFVSQIGGAFAQDNSQGKYLNFSIVAPQAGSYTLGIRGMEGTCCAITTITVNGVIQGTIDWYAATTAERTQELTISLTRGANVVRLTPLTKNALGSWSVVYSEIWIVG